MLPGRFYLSLVALCCGLLAWPMSASAQDKEKGDDATKPEKARFKSVDGVELQGMFYPSSKKTAPVVILLHALGEDSRKKNWVSLAEDLQKGGLNVLSFDFRGHGESKEVDPEKFWSFEQNKLGASGPKRNTTKRYIEFKDFNPLYYPTIINDIAAARAFLERTKNDAMVCSTSNIIVIGADSGATLGAMWMNSEHFRYRLIPPALAGQEPRLDTRAEGKDIIGAVWLSLSPKLGKRGIFVDRLVHISGLVGNTPMVFMYGDGDATGRAVAKGCEKHLKSGGEKNRFTVAVELKDSKLTGSDLLQDSLGSRTAIVDYLAELVEAKQNEFIPDREFRKTQYYWRIPNGFGGFAELSIKPVGEMNIIFDTYDKFLPPN